MKTAGRRNQNKNMIQNEGKHQTGKQTHCCQLSNFLTIFSKVIKIQKMLIQYRDSFIYMQ